MRPISFLKTYLAKNYVKFYSSDMFVGIAGSVEKSACLKFSAAVCSQKYKTLANPQTLFKITPSTQKVILETWDQHVKPKVIIFTKAADSEIAEMTRQIESLDESGTAILNWDDPHCRKLAASCRGKVFFYGMDPQNCSVWAGNIRIENFTSSFELNHGVERVKVDLKLLGLNQVYSALAASLLGVISDIPLTKSKLALERVESSEHQMQALFGPNGSILLDDTYNNSPLGIDNAIETLLQIPARRRIIVLGEMREPEQDSENLHRQIARKIYKEKLDLVFLGQGQTEFIADELKSLGFWEERLEFNMQNSQLVAKLLKTLGKVDVCLIEGPRAVRLDEVVKRIAKKI